MTLCYFDIAAREAHDSLLVRPRPRVRSQRMRALMTFVREAAAGAG